MEFPLSYQRYQVRQQRRGQYDREDDLEDPDENW